MTYKNHEGISDSTAGQVINGVRWEEVQRMREKQYGIKRGEILTLKITEKGKDGKTVRTRQRKMKAIELYKHHALLESSIGIRESMGYWKLAQCRSKTGGGSSGQQRRKGTQ